MYKSGENAQVDYVMCKRRNLKEMCNCKVMVNECVANQEVKKQVKKRLYKR